MVRVAIASLPATTLPLMSASSSWKVPVSPSREPIFNVPAVILTLAAIMGLVHVLFWLVLSPDQVSDALVLFSFIPARYSTAVLAEKGWATGWGAAVWSIVTYAFIHGSVLHLSLNMIWLFAFGTPVARRFGTARFFAFFCAAAVAGALVHLATHVGEPRPIVGASASISGAMAAALRFIFVRGGLLGSRDAAAIDRSRVPAASLSEMFRDVRVLAFIAVWFGTNIIFGAGGVSMPGQEQDIAWEAHIGGFLMGLFGFSLFDPPRPLATEAEPRDGATTVGDDRL
jgi:membrane associated rhomboid family serine protease